MSGITRQMMLWDLDREVSRHLMRAQYAARRGMLEEANAEYRRADKVKARRDKLREELSQ